MSGRIQIIESETQPDKYAIAYDNDINGDDFIALLARTRKSERGRIAAQLECIGIAMSKSHVYSPNDTTRRAQALYEASQIIGGTSKHTCLDNPCGRTWFHV